MVGETLMNILFYSNYSCEHQSALHTTGFLDWNFHFGLLSDLHQHIHASQRGVHKTPLPNFLFYFRLTCPINI